MGGLRGDGPWGEVASAYGLGETALVLCLEMERGLGAVGKSSKKLDLCRRRGDFWIPPGGTVSVALMLALRGGGGG